jgi:hypothetical protein
MMNERIAARIAELDAAEKETLAQLIRIQVVIAELRALLAPPPAAPGQNGATAEPIPQSEES